MKHSPKIKHTKIIIKMDLFQTWEPCWNLLMSILVAIFLCFGVVFHSILSFFWSRLSLEPLSLPSLESLPEGTFSKHGFVDDGIGAFKDKTHADYFLTYLNSRNTDLQYTVEHPQQDGSLPFLDILIHGDRSTSVYRIWTELKIRFWIFFENDSLWEPKEMSAKEKCYLLRNMVEHAKWWWKPNLPPLSSWLQYFSF